MKICGTVIFVPLSFGVNILNTNFSTKNMRYHIENEKRKCCNGYKISKTFHFT